jgi:hypothetical protein
VCLTTRNYADNSLLTNSKLSSQASRGYTLAIDLDRRNALSLLSKVHGVIDAHSKFSFF